MLYTNVNTANYEMLKKLINAVDGKEPGYTEVSRTGDETTYLLPSSQEITLDIEHNFPILETRAIPFKVCVVETLWYLTGNTNIKMLKDNNVKIWDHWATEEGNLGPVYGAQLRAFGGDDNIDQITNAIEVANKFPNSRQNVVSMWHPGFLPDPTKTAQENVSNGKMALPPCHMFHRLRVHPMPNSKEKYLSLHMTMRSSDFPIAGNFNTVSYALLLHMYAKVLKLKPKYLTITFMDPHIYKISNHEEATRLQIQEYEKNRVRYMNSHVKLTMPEKENIFDYKIEDFSIEGYNPNRYIKYTGIAI
jgi:thymidylate synthase